MIKQVEILEKNIQDQLIEAQIKLGFVNETMRLYYPLDSLNAMLESAIAEPEQLCALLREQLEQFSFSVHQGRIEVNVPAEYVSYVHDNCDVPEFLVALISLFQNHHHLDLSQVKEVFARFGAYICEKMPEGADFDYAIHFEDDSIDEYYYCIKLEMGHLIYHRFTKVDYEKII